MSQIKTENPFYQCPHCDDNFENFDDITTHIEDEHDNDAGENVVKCSECHKQLPRNHEAIKQHMLTEHMPPDLGKNHNQTYSILWNKHAPWNKRAPWTDWKK